MTGVHEKYPRRIPMPVNKELNNKNIYIYIYIYTYILYSKKKEKKRKTMLHAQDYPKTFERNKGKTVLKKESQRLL